MSLVPKKESDSIINQLKSKLAEIKDRIKGEGVSSVVFGELTANAKEIQSKLDEILRAGGVLTEQQKNEAYLILQEQEKREIKNRYKKDSNRMIAIAVGFILLTGAIIFYTKKKK